MDDSELLFDATGVPIEPGAPEGRDAVLVGHSYGGAIISAVVDAGPSRVRALVYLDALVPENGRLQLVDDQRRRARLVHLWRRA